MCQSNIHINARTPGSRALHLSVSFTSSVSVLKLQLISVSLHGGAIIVSFISDRTESSALPVASEMYFIYEIEYKDGQTFCDISHRLSEQQW